MSDPLSSELDAAAKSGHLSKVKELLAQGANVNFLNNYGSTPLIEASLRGYEAMVRTLLEHGADVGRADSVFGATALNFAALTGQVQVVEFLLQWGADIHVRDIGGRTALTEANVWQEAEVVKLLMERGAYDNAAA